MRNLKKFLALVLAMMMALSLMVTVNAAAGDPVTDLETVTDEFQEAVQVLNGLGIITGYENGEFRPLKNITRAETTALVYRLHSGDAQNVKNNLYSTADNIAKFKDVNPNGGDQWSAGYIGYCANQEIIKGVSADRFNPNGNVTGYQVLAMVLRAIGYGQNGEYEGTGWQTRVATTATKLGLLKNVDDTNYAGTLSAAATRELVAEIVFQAALEPTVTYTPAFGYEEYGDKSLAKLNFDLDYTAYTTVDKWGRPGYYWFQDTKHDGKAVASGSGKNVVATITPKAEQTYTSTIRECDLAHDLEISKSATFDLYVNDNEPITNSYLVVATDTVTKVGGQGRLTEVYRDLKNDKMASALADRVVMIDTFLAQVTGVSAAVKDAAGHVIVPAKLTVAVYDKTDATGNAPSAGRIISKDDGTDWEYSKGDMILLNAYTDHDWSYSKSASDAANAAADATSVAAHTNVERAAFEYERVAVKDYAYLDEPSSNTTAKQVNDLEYAEVLGVAKSTVAKQSVVYWNQEKHDVGGTDYPDQLDLFLNVAGTTVNSDFSWYFDQYDNVIGIGEAVRSNYGVITSIYSSFSAADGSTDGKAVAKAHVKFADGTEADVIIDRFLVSNEGDLEEGHQAAGTQIDGANATAASRKVAELLPVYDYNAGTTTEVLTMTGAAAAAGYTAPSNVAISGQLLVAPVAAINKALETQMNGVSDGESTPAAVTGSPYFGIIEQNLFKFISSGDGKMTAMEVAGSKATANTDIFAWNYNVIDSSNATEWKKNAGFLTVNSVVIRVDNNTQIMLKEGNEINVYNGLSDLPGDVDIAKFTEVDWSDANGDGIADVLYTTATVKGKVSHNLFYYNGGAAQWNGVDKKGTLDGWLDGVATTLTFSNEKLFNLVKDSVAVYPGHMFAVEVTNNEVTNLFADVSKTAGAGVNNAGTHDERIAIATPQVVNDGSTTGLMKNSTPINSLDVAQGVSTDAYTTTANRFKTGNDGGNDYTTSTKIVYGQVTGAAGTYANGTVTVGGTNYTLTGVSKVLGNDLSYLNLTGRISDVTIVYENNTLKTIDAIYVTTEPDNTVSGTNLTFGDGFIVAQAGLKDDRTATAGSPVAGGLGEWLLRFNGGVFYSKDSVAKTQHANKETMMYFPFPAGNAGVYTLNIYKNGILRFSESGTIAVGKEGPNYFSFDFAPADDSTGSWIGGGYGLSADTYTYEILFNGTPVPGTGGSFSLITK